MLQLAPASTVQPWFVAQRPLAPSTHDSIAFTLFLPCLRSCRDSVLVSQDSVARVPRALLEKVAAARPRFVYVHSRSLRPHACRDCVSATSLNLEVVWLVVRPFSSFSELDSVRPPFTHGQTPHRFPPAV